MSVLFRTAEGIEERVEVRPGTCQDVVIDLGLCGLPPDRFAVYSGGRDVSRHPLSQFDGEALTIALNRPPNPVPTPPPLPGAAQAPTLARRAQRTAPHRRTNASVWMALVATLIIIALTRPIIVNEARSAWASVRKWATSWFDRSGGPESPYPGVRPPTLKALIGIYQGALKQRDGSLLYATLSIQETNGLADPAGVTCIFRTQWGATPDRGSYDEASASLRLELLGVARAVPQPSGGYALVHESGGPYSGWTLVRSVP